MTNLALIGAGKWGQNYLTIAYLINHCRIKYVYSQSQSTLNSLPNEYVKTNSLEDLFSSKIDGAIIATPATTHFEISKKFLNHNFNLLIEKPLTTNLYEAMELRKIWFAKKTKILVGHTYLYNPAFRKCKQLLKTFGPVKSISFEGILSADRQDVSVLWDWGPHPVSLMLDMIGKPVKQIHITDTHKLNNKLDTLKVILTFENNVKGLIHISWFGSKKIRRLIIEGQDQKIVLDDTNQEDKKIIYYGLNSAPSFPEYHLESPLVSELREFVDAIEGRNKISSDINLGVSVVKVLSDIENLI